MRVIYLGSGEFGLPTLRALAERHEVVAVVSQPDRPAGRKRQLTSTPVAAWAADHGLPVLKSEDVNAPDFVERVRGLGPDAGVVIAFGQKLSPPLIEAMGQLAVNLHASILPKYRGAAPINWAMIHGDSVTGVSVIGLAKRMDAGEVYATAETSIRPEETAGELHDRLAALGPDAVLNVLDDLHRSSLRPQPQADDEATKAPKFRKEDGTVRFDQPAEQVRARVHGLTPWPGCRVTWQRAEEGGEEAKTLTLARVRAHPQDSHRAEPGTVLEGFRVAAKEGTVELLEVQAPGTRVMLIEDFARGHPFAAGDRLEPLT